MYQPYCILTFALNLQLQMIVLLNLEILYIVYVYGTRNLKR